MASPPAKTPSSPPRSKNPRPCGACSVSKIRCDIDPPYSPKRCRTCCIRGYDYCLPHVPYQVSKMRLTTAEFSPAVDASGLYTGTTMPESEQFDSSSQSSYLGSQSGTAPQSFTPPLPEASLHDPITSCDGPFCSTYQGYSFHTVAPLQSVPVPSSVYTLAPSAQNYATLNGLWSPYQFTNDAGVSVNKTPAQSYLPGDHSAQYYPSSHYSGLRSQNCS